MLWVGVQLIFTNEYACGSVLSPATDKSQSVHSTVQARQSRSTDISRKKEWLNQTQAVA